MEDARCGDVLSVRQIGRGEDRREKIAMNEVTVIYFSRREGRKSVTTR